MGYGEQQSNARPFNGLGRIRDDRGMPSAFNGNPVRTGPYGMPYRSQNSDTYATDTYADLTRAEYADYKKRFQPFENQLMSLADSEAMLDEQLSKISANGVSRYKKSQANSALNNQRYGIQSNARETNYSNTKLDSRRGLDIAQAKNMSRLQSEDSKSNILTGAGSTRQLNNQG